MYPDMTEYADTYATDYVTLGGTNMTVYSAQDYSTVDLHFQWMKDYNIDGAFVQRFISTFESSYGNTNHDSSKAKNIDTVLSHCRTAAETHGQAPNHTVTPPQKVFQKENTGQLKASCP